MKICIVIGAFLPIPPKKGGAVEKRWLRLAEEFAALGHEVTMISRTYPGLPERETLRGVAHVRVAGYDTPASPLKLKLLDLLYALRARRAVPADVDIVVTNTFWAPVVIRGQQRGCVYVDVARMPKGQMRLYRKVGRLRANSTPVAEAIKAELPAARHGRVRMIPNPLPFVPEGLPPKPATPSFLYVGRVHPEKGVHVLLAALHAMDTPMPTRIVGPWHVQEGGGGEAYWQQLQTLAAGLPVVFVGPVFDMDALNAEYAKATVFVYPSLAEKGETFGLAPLEAMAWGCVPVVSDLACFKDFIHHDINGWVFNHRAPEPQAALATCLQAAMAKPARMTAMAGEALRVRQSHSSKSIAEAFLQDFAEVAQHSRKGST